MNSWPKTRIFAQNARVFVKKCAVFHRLLKPFLPNTPESLAYVTISCVFSSLFWQSAQARQTGAPNLTQIPRRVLQKPRKKPNLPTSKLVNLGKIVPLRYAIRTLVLSAVEGTQRRLRDTRYVLGTPQKLRDPGESSPDFRPAPQPRDPSFPVFGQTHPTNRTQ